MYLFGYPYNRPSRFLKTDPFNDINRKKQTMYTPLKRLFTVLSMIAVIAASSGVAAQAESLASLPGELPDLLGDTLDYTNFKELDISTDPISALFFGPTGEIFGDTLTFSPPENFNSLSNDGELNFRDGRLSFEIRSRDDATFNELTIDESGAYNIFGDGSAQVGLVAEVITPSGVYRGSTSFTPSGDSGGTQSWELDLSFAFPATDRAIVVLDNQLLTASEDVGDLAFIDKKRVQITPTTIAIPEPSSLALIGLTACLGLGARRRKIA